MAQKRLTAVKFRQLLADHPKFNLNEGVWICNSAKGKPCGGCAMTLAYKGTHPSVNLNRSNGLRIAAWADETYGEDYASDFIGGFDDGLYDEDDDDLTVGTKDGNACRKAAIKLGRLQVDE